MYSLNAPVPDRVAELAASLPLGGFERVREDRSVLVKRLDTGDRATAGVAGFPELARRAEAALAGAPACAARVTGVGAFYDPPAGTAPVVYLAVESPGLVALHRRLAREFPPVPEIEGEDYVPHVTLARGGSRAAAERLTRRDVPSVEWTVEALLLYDARHGEPARRYALPYSGDGGSPG